MMVIAIDFDGTIVSQDRDYDDVKTPLEFLPGAKEGLQALRKAGHTLVLFSARSDPSLWEDWKLSSLNTRAGFRFDVATWEKNRRINWARHRHMLAFVNKELPGIFACEYAGRAKPAGVDLFLDDRALGAASLDWKRVVSVWGE